jgi:ribosomal protein S18 acetylase RimI-like enzyme
MEPQLRLAPAETDQALAACFGLMRQLRPQLADAASFTAQVRRQAAHGYRVLALWDGERAVACAGYRVSENLIRGRHMYVDDLVTDAAARSHGHGDALFDALVAEARRQDCRCLVLDSGLDNGAAHRFYFRRRLTIAAFRFALPLD